MNRQIESMTKFRAGPYTVRVWRSAETLAQAEAQSFSFDTPNSISGATAADIAEQMAGVKGVAAVEVVDDFGCGVLIYPDWP